MTTRVTHLTEYHQGFILVGNGEDNPSVALLKHTVRMRNLHPPHFRQAAIINMTPALDLSMLSGTTSSDVK